MSHHHQGVIVSHASHVQVSVIGLADPLAATASDAALDRFLRTWGTTWVPAEVTLTRLHLALVPQRAHAGVAMTQLALRDVRRVEVAGRVTGVVGFRTRRHLVRVRMVGVQRFAEQVSVQVRSTRIP